MGVLTRKTYEDLIQGDVEWLRKQPKTLKRDHIEVVLRAPVAAHYPGGETTAAFEDRAYRALLEGKETRRGDDIR